MDSRTASSGPKDGSTSPSATPLENEPGGGCTGIVLWHCPSTSPCPQGTTNSPSSPCLQLPSTKQAKNQQWGWQHSTQCHTLEKKKSGKQNKMCLEYLVIYHCSAKGDRVA